MEGGDEADPKGGEKRKPGADPAPVLAKRHHGAVPLGNEELWRAHFGETQHWLQA